MTQDLLSVDDLRAEVAAGTIDTVICAFPDLYGRLMGKRLDAGFFQQDPEGGTHACGYLFTVDMEMEPVDGYDVARWAQGYGDVHLVPDLGTLRRCTWLDRAALVLCDAALGHDLVRVVAAQHHRCPGRPSRCARLHGHGGQRARVLPLPRHLRVRRRTS